MRYAVVLERAAGNYSAYVPDLPGCVATGQTCAEAETEFVRPSSFTLMVCAKMACPFRRHPATSNMSKCRH